MNSANIRQYIGLDDPKTFDEIVSALDALKRDELTETLSYLTPKAKGERAVLFDSRQVTDFGDILLDSRALSRLRSTLSIEEAIRLLKSPSIVRRLQALMRECELLANEITDAEATKKEIAELVDCNKRFMMKARQLRDAIEGLEER